MRTNIFLHSCVRSQSIPPQSASSYSCMLPPSPSAPRSFDSSAYSSPHLQSPPSANSNTGERLLASFCYLLYFYLWFLSDSLRFWLFFSSIQGSYRLGCQCQSRSQELSHRAWVRAWVSTGPDYSEQQTIVANQHDERRRRKKRACKIKRVRRKEYKQAQGWAIEGPRRGCRPQKCIKCLQIQPRAALVALNSTPAVLVLS